MRCPRDATRGIASAIKGSSARGVNCRPGRPGTPSTRCWAALGHTDQPVAVGLDEHEEVGEGQVGEQLPLGDDPLEVAGDGPGEIGVLGEQIGEVDMLG